MSDVLIDQDTMEDIGDSIRSKLGVQTTYLPSEMPSAIMSISGGGGGSVSGSSPFIDSSGTPINVASGTNAGGTWTATIDCFVIFYANWRGEKFFEIYIDESDRILYPYNDSSNRNRFEYIYVKKGQVLKWKFSDNSSNYHIVTAWPLLKNEALQTALIYSEEEREVGVWTDGKPLYAKTVSFTITVGNGYTRYTHNIANITPIAVEGETHSTTDDIIYTIGVNAAANLSFGFSTDAVYFYQSSSYFNGWNARATLFYTKTTDQPGSGTWITTGEYAHHYSTTEHVIGTWIDGSTIYEKTMIVNNPPINTWVEYDIGVPDLDRVIKQEGTFDRDIGSGGVWTYDLNAVNESSWNNSYVVVARIRNATKKLAVYVGGTYPNSVIRFTFRYTKTT